MGQTNYDEIKSPGEFPLTVVLSSRRFSTAALPAGFPLPSVEAETWEDAFSLLSRLRPGCVLIDFDDQRDQNVEQIRRFADHGVRFAVVGVTAQSSRRSLHQAIRHGLLDLLSLPLDLNRLFEAVAEAIEVDTAGKDSLFVMRSRYRKLTPKEREVLPHLLLGVSSRRLAGQFYVTYQTIDRHRKRVIEKMEVDNMTELAMKLYRQY